MDANIFYSVLRKVPDVENFLDSLMVAVEKCRKEQRVLIHYSVLFQNDTWM